MEDEYYVAEGGRFAAVFDGHGGGGVSAHLRRRLHDLFEYHLARAEEDYQLMHAASADAMLPPTSSTSGGNMAAPIPSSSHSVASSLNSRVAAIRAAFDDVEREVCLDDDLQYQGSTAAAVLLHEDGDGTKTLLSANVGDSRAILSRRGLAVDLTRDHKPNDERERARIHGMGETIEWDHYCKIHRVRNLSLSRAIGDRFAKPVVSGEVEIKRYPMTEEGDEFVIVASDGLWDVLSSQETVDFVKRKLEAIPSGRTVLTEAEMERMKYARRKNMSRHVANEALRKGSGDNICVVIIWLKGARIDQTLP